MMLPLYGMIRNHELPELYIIKRIRFELDRINSFNQVVSLFVNKLRLNYAANENVYMFCYLNDGTPIGICEVSKGGIKSSFCSMNIIGRYILLTGCDKFILIHNHPDNNCKPSGNDLLVTNNVMEVANLLEVNMEEHLIICRKGWFCILNERGFDL